MHKAFLPRLHRLPALIGALLLTLAGTPAPVPAAQDVSRPSPLPAPAAPRTARLSPSGGLLTVTERAPVLTENGASRLHLVLPAGAGNVRIAVPGHTVARWNIRSPVAAAGAASTSARSAKAEEIQKAEGMLASAKARLSLLTENMPASGNFEDMIRHERRLAEAVPALHEEVADLTLLVERLRKELKGLPPEPETFQIVEALLAKPVREAHLPVSYSYTLENCGWHPRYEFDARPDAEHGDAVTVRFIAELWQHSGMDWAGTELTLVSGGAGPREPNSLPRWVIESDADRARPQPTGQARKDSAAPMMATRANFAEAEEDQAPAAPVAKTDTAATFASWTLAARGLPAGRSRVLVLEEAWKTPLQWLARPRLGASRAWLVARCQLPAERAWPAGVAEFSLDGQAVGQGRFAPRGSEVSLYFGPDPRVQVHATADSRTRGEEGFISKSRTWSWSWTYTVHNERDRPVQVRLERPMPQAVDKEVAIAYADKPESKKDRREHKLYWDVPVAAHDKAEVRHAVTITSPKELRLSPVAP